MTLNSKVHTRIGQNQSDDHSEAISRMKKGESCSATVTEPVIIVGKNSYQK
ncbi:hypothetical protein Desor_0635 [Desulfosporosinus orientis DSM 765]|uniref:Uncharacterized protein n=1 Tax=Desulfosporosinus orientis (strain ATCC 19365 / DSM 765 / NCIMB 8382 / VKM B-1628 / Singapore I) TaxID=768706 RepID=G7W5A1_DESOD|nr:hypothetical protein Desor_0635 [Desulfosporosinus orientis DSM 765]